MSEYQYYEFRAIDRPLDRPAQDALRSISSRAKITATSFTNHYEWGDLNGDPREMVARWFDLHLYLANWGSRRLMMRLPARLVNRDEIARFLVAVDWVEVWASGDNLIVDIIPDECEAEDEWDDGAGRLAELAPLRADVLAGDFRLFYLLWLTAVQHQLVPDEDTEPLPGIGPLSDALEAFAAFFAVDPDLVQAAAEREWDGGVMSEDEVRAALAAIPDQEKVELLKRVLEGDGHVGAELKRLGRGKLSTSCRTAGVLRLRAGQIAAAAKLAEAERREAERRQREEGLEKARRARLAQLKTRGADVWREVEGEIERRNASGYDQAAALLTDLQALAVQEGWQSEFNRRLASIRVRHGAKRKLIERLAVIVSNDGAG